MERGGPAHRPANERRHTGPPISGDDDVCAQNGPGKVVSRGRGHDTIPERLDVPYAAPRARAFWLWSLNISGSVPPAPCERPIASCPQSRHRHGDSRCRPIPRVDRILCRTTAGKALIIGVKADYLVANNGAEPKWRASTPPFS